jgi:hypothetical protein
LDQRDILTLKGKNKTGDIFFMRETCHEKKGGVIRVRDRCWRRGVCWEACGRNLPHATKPAGWRRPLAPPYRPGDAPEVLVSADAEDGGAQRYLLAIVIGQFATATGIAIVFWPFRVAVFD